MSATADPELESFKHIDLRSYAATEGYELDRAESWRGSSVMRHSNGDKIIIKRNSNGHYVYFSVRDESDNGSIIDFAQKRRGGNLGQVRNHLRNWTAYSGGQRTALSFFAPLQPTAKDRLEIERQFRWMDFVERHPYLEQERGIPYDILTAARFAGRIRVDRRGNAVFPHFDQDGLCGYEIRNAGYKGFAKGGEKGLWFSHTEPTDTQLVICEGAIDALSYATLFPADATRYASISGAMNKRQPALLQAVFAKLPQGCEVIAATDNDSLIADAENDQGLHLAETIGQLVAAAGRADLRFTVHRPPTVKDWNLVLKEQAILLPIAQIS